MNKKAGKVPCVTLFSLLVSLKVLLKFSIYSINSAIENLQVSGQRDLVFLS